MAKTRDAGVLYQFKITLKHIKPPVWRRVLVKDCTLASLHDVIQTCMGWTDSHLHSFLVGDEEYGRSDPDSMMVVLDETRITLSQALARGINKFGYTYDFWNNWEHSILIEKTVEPKAGVRYPRCVAGRRACPPEDCGGPCGYGDFLDAISDPRNEQHGEMLEWIGGEFDPEEFDLEAVNDSLA